MLCSVPHRLVSEHCVEDGQELAHAGDELELVYLHLYSLRNFSEVKDRLIGSLAEPPEAWAVEPSDMIQ